MTIIEETTDIQATPNFGNGHSLKYYNFLHFVFIPVVIFNQINGFTSLMKMLGDESGFQRELLLSSAVPWLMSFFYLANLVLDGLAVNGIIKKDDWKFSLWFLVRYPVSMVGVIIVSMVLSSTFPQTTQAAASSMAKVLFSNLLIFVPNAIYLSKRMKRDKAPL